MTTRFGLGFSIVLILAMNTSNGLATRTSATIFVPRSNLAINACRGPANAMPRAPMVSVPRSKLCVTEGALTEVRGSHRLAVDVPKMRAVVAASTPPTAEARLTYLGPTNADVPLASGEMRRQFGLKLRAQDGCNLIYAMWRIEPESKLVVSIKSNPGMHSSPQCGNRGYRNIKPTRASRAPRLSPGESHSLVADMNGSEMRVSIDGKAVWEGDLGPEAAAFDGPVGVRTDNGRFEFELFTHDVGATQPCRTGEGEKE